MMVLYSGTTCPFSQRCRFVLFEKGMDFEIRDVDLFNKPEDVSVMNPYGQVPILVERDLILYESNIINEYIDERFPHPQLMPGDPVARARVRLFLFNFEKELFVHVTTLESTWPSPRCCGASIITASICPSRRCRWPSMPSAFSSAPPTSRRSRPPKRSCASKQFGAP